METTDVTVLRPPAQVDETTLRALLSPHGRGPAASPGGEPAGEPGPDLVLDLADVEYLDSASLGALVREGMRLDAAGRRLVLARPQRVVERTLRLLGLQVKLPIFPTVAQARAAAVARRAAPEV